MYTGEVELILCMYDEWNNLRHFNKKKEEWNNLFR